MKKLTLIISGLFLSMAVYAQTEWTIDKAHSEIGFIATHMMVSEVEGEFEEFDATVITNGDKFDGAQVSFTTKVNSINTGIERRDGHLKSEDFFYAEKYPEISFKGIIQKIEEEYLLIGSLTMRGTTKDVKLPVKYNGMVNAGDKKIAGFKVLGTVNRMEYGLKWNKMMEAGGVVVSEEIDIKCNVELNTKS